MLSFKEVKCLEVKGIKPPRDSCAPDALLFKLPLGNATAISPMYLWLWLGLKFDLRIGDVSHVMLTLLLFITQTRIIAIRMGKPPPVSSSPGLPLLPFVGWLSTRSCSHVLLSVWQDPFLAEMLQNNKDQIACYHEHDSLLDHKEEEELSEEDRKAAWAEYEAEKKAWNNLIHFYSTVFSGYPDPLKRWKIDQVQSAANSHRTTESVQYIIKEIMSNRKW